MNLTEISLLLADDDPDDCLFFEEALDELPFSVKLTCVNNGEELMLFLAQENQVLPTILFLDLNMPRKNGLECLIEIKRNDKLKALPIIIYSTSLDTKTAEIMYDLGAHHYIRKPSEFSKLKDVIGTAIQLTVQSSCTQPDKDNFIIQI